MMRSNRVVMVFSNAAMRASSAAMREVLVTANTVNMMPLKRSAPQSPSRAGRCPCLVMSIRYLAPQVVITHTCEQCQFQGHTWITDQSERWRSAPSEPVLDQGSA